MNCPTCNAPLSDGAAFCGNCGTKLAPQAAPAPVAPVQAAPAAGAPPAGAQPGAPWAGPQPDGQYQQPYQQPSYQQPYQQPGYGQAQAPAQQSWPPQTATHRAFAMTLYVSSLIGVIFGLCVRDKDDAFITHHLNNAVVILIGSFVGCLLSIIVIGIFLLIYLFVMVIMGIVSAYNGDMKELPLIGKIHIIK